MEFIEENISVNEKDADVSYKLIYLKNDQVDTSSIQNKETLSQKRISP